LLVLKCFWKIGLLTDLVILIGLLEVISGIALFVGVLTKIPSIFFIIEMIGSTMVAILPGGFMAICSGPLLVVISVSLTTTIEWNVLKRELFPKAKEILLHQ
jgi:uncharacterized membrane protein YphA (DoxX/SURF4 family)